jgi:hypothetical protein
MGVKRNPCRVLAGIPGRKRPRGSIRHRWRIMKILYILKKYNGVEWTE